MSLNERRALYQKIEEHRKRPLIVYVTSKRPGIDASMATDALPYLIDHLHTLPPDTTQLDLLIVSFGGDPMVAWRIMSLIRARGIDHVSALIPQSAYSAATLIALGANEIIMHPNGHLGPVDMQIRAQGEGKLAKQFSTEDVSAFLDFVRDDLKITDQRHLRRLFEITCKEVGTLGVGFTARSSRLAVALGEKLLGMHMDEDDDPGAGKRKGLVQKMSRQFHSHSYPVSRTEAIEEIGLDVNRERDPVLEALMWDVWLDLEAELLERLPFSPVTELLNSPTGAQLFADVPQLNLPQSVCSPNYYTLDLDKIKQESLPISAVDISTIGAIGGIPKIGAS